MHVEIFHSFISPGDSFSVLSATLIFGPTYYIKKMIKLDNFKPFYYDSFSKRKMYLIHAFGFYKDIKNIINCILIS